jgi:two-component system, NarL family, response regulator DevR
VLTFYDDEHALRTAVLAGGSAFVLKDVHGNGLVVTIRRKATT